MPLHGEKLRKDEQYGVLELLTLIKKKCCGKVKGRVCANRQKQSRYIRKENVFSPTVQLESIMTTLAVDAMENRNIATVDVAGAYLKTIMTDEVIVKISGTAADIKCAKLIKGLQNTGYKKRKKKRNTLYFANP